MRIVLMGPQGAGKGTQAKILAERTGADHVSTGDLVRAEIQADSELGRKVKEYNDRGELVPDEIIVEMAKPYLRSGGWILDGFPRNRAQAEALDGALKELGVEVESAVALEAPDEELIARLAGRRQSESTGRIYHIEHDPPPPEDKGPFVQRKDDTEEAIRRRLEIYHEQTEPLKEYYGERGLLVTVDARRSIPEVTEEILAAVGDTK